MRLAVLGLMLVSGVAGAAGERPRVAILEVTVGGDVTAAQKPRVEKSLEGGLYTAGFEVVGEREVAGKLKRARSLAGCTSTTCLGRIGELVGARQFVRARLNGSGGAYDLELELLAADAESGLVRRVERSCAACTMRDLNDLLSRSVVELMVPPPPVAVKSVKVRVTTSPAGALVAVDGSVIGKGPVEVEVEPGAHAFEASTESGYQSTKKTVTVEGERVDVQLELVPAAPVAPVAEPRGARFGAWKWAAAGGALAAVGAGVALIALDGKGTDCVTGQPCRRVYDTLGGGIALAGAGVGLGALATWMFLADSRAAVTVEKGGVALVVGGTF